MEEAIRLKKEIVRLALPIAFQQFMTAFVGASDALMLGRLSQSAMSAVSLATQVTFVFNLFMAAFVIGENMFVAQYYGKKDLEHISKVFCLVLTVSCMTAIVFWTGTYLFPEEIMQILTDDQELAALGSIYLKIVGVSYLCTAAAQVCMTVMKNCGAVGMSTAVSMTTVTLNILLNALWIPAKGVQGAALATAAATGVQAVWSAGYLAMKKNRINLRLCRSGKVLRKQFWQKTTPVLGNELIWGCGFTMYSVIMGHLGADAVAANSIANISKNLIICLCLGLGSAGSIVVGNLLGADRFEEARQAGKMLTKLSVLCGVLSGGILLALSPLILRWAALTPQAQDYLRGMLVICSYYLVGKSINSMTIGGIFPAGGDGKFGLLCDTVTLWCVTIPLGCLCAFIWEFPVPVVYFVLNLDEILKLPAVRRHYRKYGWLKNIT